MTGATNPETPAQRMQRGMLEMEASAPDERREAAQRVGQAMRLVIDRLTATSASPAVLDEAVAKITEVIALLEAHRSRRSYEGLGEASGTGRHLQFFDWSPQAGLANPIAPPIRLALEGDAVVGTTRFGAAYEGPPGGVHGGFVAAAFDEVLGLAQSMSGKVGMTANLTVNYRRPTPLHADIRIEGRLESVVGRKVLTSGKLLANGQVTAEATGLFVSVSPERFAALADNRPADGAESGG
jgi:acyl-coenzyme A thioesterase PaaI-like protein